MIKPVIAEIIVTGGSVEGNAKVSIGHLAGLRQKDGSDLANMGTAEWTINKIVMNSTFVIKVYSEKGGNITLKSFDLK